MSLPYAPAADHADVFAHFGADQVPESSVYPWSPVFPCQVGPTWLPAFRWPDDKQAIEETDVELLRKMVTPHAPRQVTESHWAFTGTPEDWQAPRQRSFLLALASTRPDDFPLPGRRGSR